jgi:hypothetical protein
LNRECGVKATHNSRLCAGLYRKYPVSFLRCFQTVKALLRSMFNQRADASTGPRAADPAAPQLTAAIAVAL